ncbi:hypothetical protein [Streptomyces marincola]|uniref:Uncharacterized protein n=1 Tax=Streptomyces marincola TaxID=2878388 RepID=A0A1W7CV48_9ACTN|nr:hypothetical protein [Streptomyces marincola]ARQ68250.1 hypothetical protein CAG99_04795 [Streptomyces marincola]
MVLGRDAPAERFTDAVNTLTLEGMTGGKAPRRGTGREPGQSLSRASGTGSVPESDAAPGTAAVVGRSS